MAAQSWESGQLSFDDEPLTIAAARNNRIARKPLVIADPALGNLRISGVFTAGESESLAAGIAALHDDIRVRETGDAVHLEKK